MAAPEGTKKILLIIGAVLAVFTLVFGVSVTRNHNKFAEYKAATLDDPEHPPRWMVEEVSVEGCVDEAMQWSMECPGVQSWCLAQLPSVVRSCLETQNRADYCEQAGDEVMSTRFGFHQCEALREPVGGKYGKRAHKKYCAMSYRAIAGHCQDLRQEG